MNSFLSICHKNVHDFATQVYTMLTYLSLHYSKSFLESVANYHFIFLLLKMNQICLLLCSIFKSNYASLHGNERCSLINQFVTRHSVPFPSNHFEYSFPKYASTLDYLKYSSLVCNNCFLDSPSSIFTFTRSLQAICIRIIYKSSLLQDNHSKF